MVGVSVGISGTYLFKITTKSLPLTMSFTVRQPSIHAFIHFSNHRYKILAPNAIPTGFIDGKVAADKLIESLQLEQSEYRVGATKVFFKAGIVGELEDMRDERLSKIIAQFQAYCKGFLMRKEYKKMCDQRYGKRSYFLWAILCCYIHIQLIFPIIGNHKINKTFVPFHVIPDFHQLKIKPNIFVCKVLPLIHYLFSLTNIKLCKSFMHYFSFSCLSVYFFLTDQIGSFALVK